MNGKIYQRKNDEENLDDDILICRARIDIFLILTPPIYTVYCEFSKDCPLQICMTFDQIYLSHDFI